MLQRERERESCIFTPLLSVEHFSSLSNYGVWKSVVLSNENIFLQYDVRTHSDGRLAESLKTHLQGFSLLADVTMACVCVFSDRQEAQITPAKRLRVWGLNYPPPPSSLADWLLRCWKTLQWVTMMEITFLASVWRHYGAPEFLSNVFETKGKTFRLRHAIPVSDTVPNF